MTKKPTKSKKVDETAGVDNTAATPPAEPAPTPDKPMGATVRPGTLHGHIEDLKVPY